MNVIKQYLSSLKSIEIESLTELFFFRPFAYVFVKLFYPTPLTPNQISFIAMMLGIGAGISLATGTVTGFVAGGVLLILAQTIDCTDGMIARLKKNGTKTGRIVDGATDYITSISVFVGLAFGLGKMIQADVLDLPMHPWVFVLVTGFFSIVHSVVLDTYRNRYEYYVYGKNLHPGAQKLEFQAELERLNQLDGHRFDKLIIKIYLGYINLQTGKKSIEDPESFDAQAYAKSNRPVIFLWNIIGPSEHNLMFAIAAILVKPMLFFYFVVVFANIWMVMVLAIQWYTDKKMRKEAWQHA